MCDAAGAISQHPKGMAWCCTFTLQRRRAVRLLSYHLAHVSKEDQCLHIITRSRCRSSIVARRACYERHGRAPFAVPAPLDRMAVHTASGSRSQSLAGAIRLHNIEIQLDQVVIVNHDHHGV